MWYCAHPRDGGNPIIVSSEEARKIVGMTVSCVQFFGFYDYCNHCAVSFDPRHVLPGKPATLIYINPVSIGIYLMLLGRFESGMSMVRNLYVVVVEDGVVVYSEESLNQHSYYTEMLKLGVDFINSNPRYQETNK